MTTKKQAELIIKADQLSQATDWFKQQSFGVLGNIKVYIDPDCIHGAKLREISLEHLTELTFTGSPFPKIEASNIYNQRLLLWLRSDYNYYFEWHYRPDNGQQIFTMGVAR